MHIPPVLIEQEAERVLNRLNCCRELKVKR